MEETFLKDLDSRLQKQIENAQKSIDKNPAYSIDILSSIVSRNPACLEVRKILRQAQQRISKGKKKKLGGFLSKINSVPLLIGAEGRIKKDPQKVIDSAERMLNADPDNVTAHKIIGQAAEVLGLESTVIFAYETIYQLEPSNGENAKTLMTWLIQTRQNEKAAEIGEAAYRANPGDNEIQALIKEASVEQTMSRGNWQEEGSFRDKLKDEDEAQKLEQASRVKTGEGALLSLIEEAQKMVEQEPENLNYYKDIASNYRKLEEYDKAVEWVSKALQLETARADVNLKILMNTLKCEKIQKAIEKIEAGLQGMTKTEEDPARAKLEKLRAEERLIRLEQAKDLVQSYPNEYSYRYDLGRFYLEDGQLSEAIKELQLAQRSPKVRTRSLILLGKAYLEKGFHDLAVDQFNTVKSEIPGMNDQKKDVLYQLGIAYERLGNMDQAMDAFKTLYGADISYRDVAQKIDDFYSSS